MSLALPHRRGLLGSSSAWAFSGSSLDGDFVNGRCWAYGGGGFLQLLSCARASTGLAQWADGHWSSFANNTLRMTDQGLLIEEARTNSIRNNTMQGAVAGTPGTPPTNWVAPAAAGLTIQLVGTGSQNGINYIDYRFSGTTSGVFGQFLFEQTTAIAAVSGQAWAQSFFVALVGGSFTNVTAITGTLNMRGSDGANLGSINSVPANFLPSVSGSLARFGGTGTLTNGTGTTAFVAPILGFTWSSGAAIDFTVRIGWPQLELGAFATSPILTTGSTVLRAADVITLQGNALTAALAAKAARFETNLGEGISTGARMVDFNGTQLLGFTSTTVVRASNGTNNADATIGNSGTYSGLVKSAFGFDAASITSKANVGTQATSANSWGTPSGSVYIGGRSAGDRQLNAYLRRLTFGNAKGRFDGLTQ